MVEWQTDLVASYHRMDDVQPEKAKIYLQESLEILQKLHKDNRLSHYWEQWVEITKNRLVE